MVNVITSLLAVAAVVSAASGATINEYDLVGNVPKPSICNNSGTLPKGGWLTNNGCGYVTGTAIPGRAFDVSYTSNGGFHYGRYRGSGGNLCIWTLPSSLNLNTRRSVDDSCSDDTRATISHRRYFGRDFDAAPHTGNGGVQFDIDLSGCTGYLNYFTESTYSTGSFQDPVGLALPGAGTGHSGYRYTTKDGNAAMVRAELGAPYNGVTWFFVPRSCLSSQLAQHTLNNEND